MAIRQITDAQKEQVNKQQLDKNGNLICFISGEIIGPNDEVEYDHTTAFNASGATDIVNVKVVLKKYNRRKSDQTLFDVRELFQLEKLYEKKVNNIKLQDILKYKDIKHENIGFEIKNNQIRVYDSSDSFTYPVFHDAILNVDYFYAQVPIKWIYNDDEEGLQPRLIDKKRLVSLKQHLKNNPQLAPAIARLKDKSILLFDGQHKTAAQILNGAKTCDCKVFISPDDKGQCRGLFDALMKTNIEAHSKLRQVPFYTSTLVERFSVMYKELWEDFATVQDPSKQSEDEFSKFLIAKQHISKDVVKNIIQGMITDSVLSESELIDHVAKASKDSSFPISYDLLKKAIFPNCLYMNPSKAIFDGPSDFRNQEKENFKEVAKILVETSHLKDWTATKTGNLSQEQIRARRIWHKGSVLTWGPWLKDIICNACSLLTDDERSMVLYRKPLTEEDLKRVKLYLQRLFDHTFWISPDTEIDSMLTSATRQAELLKKYDLTAKYCLTGTTD